VDRTEIPNTDRESSTGAKMAPQHPDAEAMHVPEVGASGTEESHNPNAYFGSARKFVQSS